MADKLTRRQFVHDSTVAAATLATGLAATKAIAAGNLAGEDTSKILNYNPDMEYRRCGKTNLMISAVVLGGHWKRVNKIIGGEKAAGWTTMKVGRPEFQKNRHDIVTRCIERGFNYVRLRRVHFSFCRSGDVSYGHAT